MGAPQRSAQEVQPSTPSHPPQQSRSSPDWVLKNYDEATCDAPHIETEVRRLQALKSYPLLDKPQRPCYDRLARLAARVMQAPVATVSLMDLGRQWYVASVGLPPDLREVPRQDAFCAHAVLYRGDVLVVPDMAQDFRFKDHVAVTQMGIRFYAAAPLISPQGGCKVGTLCVMDVQPRPNGLSGQERETLVEMAACVMDMMEEERAVTSAQQQASEVAFTSSRSSEQQSAGVRSPVEVHRSLGFLRQQMNLLRDDHELQAVMDDDQRNTFRSAHNTCQFLYDSLVPSCENTTERCDDTMTESGRNLNNFSSKEGGGDSDHRDNCRANDDDPVGAAKADKKVGQTTSIELTKFVKSLDFVMDSFPKSVSLLFHMDSALPERAVFNDLKVFRSSIALLTSACERTTTGLVRFHMFRRQRAGCDPELVFECEDTGPDIEVDDYPLLFVPPAQPVRESSGEDCIQFDPESGQLQKTWKYCDGNQQSNFHVGNGFAVHAVAQYVGSMGGDYGFRPRGVDHQQSSRRPPHDFPCHIKTGSIFWFSVPLRLTPNPGESTANAERFAGERVAQKSLPSLYKFENIAMPSWS